MEARRQETSLHSVDFLPTRCVFSFEILMFLNIIKTKKVIGDNEITLHEMKRSTFCKGFHKNKNILSLLMYNESKVNRKLLKNVEHLGIKNRIND